MNDANLADWLSAFGQVLGAVAAVVAVGLASKQLKHLIHELRQNKFVMLLQLETEMNNRKLKVDEACNQLRLLNDKKGATENERETANAFLDGCIENWLNSADRLAYCILKGYLKEKDFKKEYRPYLEQMVTCLSDQFPPNTVYDNIITLCRRWHIEVPGH